MGTMSIAVHRVSIRNRRVERSVGVTDKVPTMNDTAVLAIAGETTLGAGGCESRMLVINTSVNDADLYPLPVSLSFLWTASTPVIW